MSAVRWGHALTIAHLELRRRFRTLQDNVWQLIAIGVLGLFFVPVLGMVFFGLYAFGSGAVDGSIDEPLRWATMGIAGIWAFVVIFGGYRAYSVALQPDRLEGLLTTVGHRELIAALVLAELSLWGTAAVLVGTLGATAFALGAGAPLAIPTFLLVIVIGLTSALLAGFALALTVRNLGVRSVLLTRLRNAMLLLAFLAYFAVLVGGAFDDIFEPLVAVLGPTPVGWLAHAALLPVDPGTSALRAAGAVLGGLVGIALLSAAAVRLAGALWYADGVTVTHRVDDPSDRGSRLEAVVSRPVAGVAVTDWTRARRAPIALSFVLYPLIVLIGPLMDTVQTGQISPGFPLWVLLCGAWITGVLFTLNILGNEAPVLEGSLLSGGVGRGLVTGHILAAVVLAGIPTVLVTVVMAVLSPHDAVGIALIAGTSVVLVVIAALVAPGIGVTFPRFEEVSITRGTKAIVPSWLAFGAFSFVLGVLALPALVGLALIESVGVRIAAGGVLITTLAGLGAGVASTIWAIRRVDGYEIDG